MYKKWQTFKNRVRPGKIRQKYFITMLLISILPIALLGFISYSIARNTLAENLHFTIPAFTEKFDKIPMSDNYDDWMPLMNKFIEQADTIEIYCWRDATKKTISLLLNSAIVLYYKNDGKLYMEEGIF